MPSLRILVTGTSGFLGGAISAHLRTAGHDVFGTVHSRSGHPGDVAVDIRRRAAFDAIDGTFDVVVHAAGTLGGARFSAAVREINVGGTANALSFARDRNCRHFVQISSIAAYGTRCAGEERREDTALASSWPNPLETEYLRSKATADRLVSASGLAFTTLRMPVVIGAGSTFSGPAILSRLRTGTAPYFLRRDRRVSVLCIGNVGPMLEAVLARGPAMRAYNACDNHLPWDALVERYTRALRTALHWQRCSLAEVVRRVNDPHFSFLISNGLLGAHFPSDALDAERPYPRQQTLERAITDEVATAV